MNANPNNLALWIVGAAVAWMVWGDQIKEKLSSLPVGWIVLVAGLVIYANPQLLDRLLPKPNPGPAPAPANSFDQYLKGITWQGDDKAELAAIFDAVADAILADASIISPRITTRDDAADLVAVTIRYRNLQNYPLASLAGAMKQAIGESGEEMTDADRQKVAGVYRQAAEAVRRA